MRIRIQGKNSKTAFFLSLLFFLQLLSGCSGEVGDDDAGIIGCVEQGALNFNPDATIADESSCEYEEVEVEDSRIVSVPYSPNCDDTNTDHCMLPFPSGSFLKEDSSNSETGYSLSIEGDAIPDTNSAVSENMLVLDRLDGFSPSTQIFTSFGNQVPDISDLANQFDISKSTDPGHGSSLLNLDTGELIHHWVELDARAQEGEPTLVFLRTLQGLEHGTSYAVAFSGLSENGSPILPSDGFRALRDNISTDNQGIEFQRKNYEDMFDSFEEVGVQRSEIQSAWWFHTASTDSILRDLLIMQSDAEERIGSQGIACNITEVIEGYGEDGKALRLIAGTITTPHYMVEKKARSPLMRDSVGDPQFVAEREIDFSMMIPQSLADNNSSGPLTVLGHGLFGNGRDYVSNSMGRYYGDTYGTTLLATDFKGWSSDGDLDAMTFALLDLKEFQYQQERQMQAVINHLTMIRTITGACSENENFFHNGTNLIDMETVNYWGISLGGLRGPSLLAMAPELDWGVLWVGGTSFTHQVERSTHYGSEEYPMEFFSLLSSEASLPSRLDRAIAIALLQSIWDSTDGETFLPFRETGWKDSLKPFDVFYLSSMMDAQVTTLSADRAVRTGNVPVINGSAHHPFAVNVVEGPVNGSAAAYFDGTFPPLPTGNTNGPGWHHSLAHNLVFEVEEAQLMAYHYLLTGVLHDYCNDSCTFEGDW
ncbi:MAG: hypothetical protein CMA00_000325 [Methanobacteriota archaeon]|nr:hypothetical protein [Candidatus Thermoplasmatota archaeon]RAH07388.1 MAG: hypothetical protein CMA00_000325 [Euryarchaeota archaeon]|tara:strand:- start:12918 stop:15038 length:2121 start_codon:yes stop_codon:yes gene_type:complete